GYPALCILLFLYIPSVKLLIASRFGDSAMYLRVRSGCPSLIIRWTMIRALKTMVQVESRKRSCRVRKTSATPASPPCVADRIASTYFDLGAASLYRGICERALSALERRLL